MKSSAIALLLTVALGLCAGLAWAEKADRNQPMNVEADAMRYDELKQTSVFTGRVVLTKGTILIRGARIEVRQDSQGHQFGVVTGEPGKLAFFRQKREGVDEFIEGESETIDYDSQADTLKFANQAQLRRYRGATLGDQLTGAVILYNNSSNVFTVDGTVTKDGAGGRVRAMLTPKPEVGVSTPASATPTPSATPALRSTTTLGGEKK